MEERIEITTTYPNGYIVKESMPVSEIWKRIVEMRKEGPRGPTSTGSGWISPISHIAPAEIILPKEVRKV